MSKILHEAVPPDKLLVSKEVDEVLCPGADGDSRGLPGHCQFLSALRVGELQYRSGEERHYFSVMWGFADVTPTRVTVLAEVAEKAEDIDIESAQAKVLEAEAKVAAGGSRDDMEAALTSLEKARLRKKVAERTKNRPH